ncbi:hypothetical protein CORC01_12327 [Colletotrichum orchidophilum]|uniref:Uncharacterized protein n=1 Tax=Colletotrichum orchidophilum TaxID=1209926 RepID=A0A1G4ATA4_9PEZI|nr:uncharacterized protein CORC01_12327 [Colletotrichum orchidophilum]OHE92400.1 hypothetical protein CORC01_12327 [Colletotrichum orchidophilum]
MQGTPLFPSHKALLIWTTGVYFFENFLSLFPFFFSLTLPCEPSSSICRSREKYCEV